MGKVHCIGVSAVALMLVTGAALAGERLQLVERVVSETTVDLGPKGDSLGDLLVFSNPVYDAENRVKVGGDQGYCVRVVVGRSWECFWTLILKDGQITGEGPVYDGRDSTLAITGGTGKYAGAKGNLNVHSRGATAYDFRYELL
jgi:allene oxide cyclase